MKTEKKSASIQLWTPDEFDAACAKSDVEARERLQATADAAVRRVQGILQDVASRHVRERKNCFPIRTSWSEILSGDGKARREKDEHLPANLRHGQPDRSIVEEEITRQVSSFGWLLTPTGFNERTLNKLAFDSLTLTPNRPD